MNAHRARFAVAGVCRVPGRAERPGCSGGASDTDPPNPSDDAALSDHLAVRRRLRELMVAPYDACVSEEIPALGGLTPLQAVRTPAGREKVEALIAQIERDGRRMEPPLDNAVPRSLLRRLGLE